MQRYIDSAKPKIIPPLDPDFKPNVLVNREFREKIKAEGHSVPLVIALERGDGSISTYKTIASSNPADLPANKVYAERLVKFLLWQRGGWKIIIGGPKEIGEHIKEVYSATGKRAFDFNFMSGVYEKSFIVEVVDAEDVPETQEEAAPLGRHLEGCRIGFDLGASDRKVAAVIDGEPVFSEEIVWDPRNQTDPGYHYSEIMAALKKAASYMPRVDAIGGSSAGVYINNHVKVASLFRGIPKDLFDTKIKNLFIDMKKDWNNIPFEVVNDGEVTALAGSMSLADNAVLGIAMGSSEAAGYVTPDGNITGWLNELAFAPIDVQVNAPIDEWSCDAGVGANYLTQQAVFRLASKVGIQLDDSQTLADKLKTVQKLHDAGDKRAEQIWETIGVYLGYAIAHYADFYDTKHVLILGRVTSGNGGGVLIKKAKEVLSKEFPSLFNKIELHLPEDESSRRVGQAVAAASLPSLS
ncbi:MAG: ROK family protein [Armatimonadota bacterium]